LIAEGSCVHEGRGVGRQSLVTSNTARIGRGRTAQAVVIRNAKYAAILAADYDGVVAKRRRRVQIGAWVVDEPHRPTQCAVRIQYKQLAFAGPHVDVAVSVDRRRRANGSAGVERPANAAIVGTQRVDRAVGTRLNDGSIARLGGAGIDVIAQAGLPELTPARRIICAHETVERA